MAEKIKNLLFDLGGVICDIDINEGIESLENLGIKNINSFLNRYKQHGIFHDFECGTVDSATFCAKLRELAGKPYLSDNQILNAWNSIIIDFPINRLKRLKELKADYQMYLLSNTNPAHREFFPSQMGFYRIEDLFHKLFLSYEMGVCKPEPQIFEMVLKDANIKAEETLFIDDSAANIEAAKQMGFQTHWVQKSSDWMLLEL